LSLNNLFWVRNNSEKLILGELWVWVAHFKWVLSLNNLFWVRNNSEKLILGELWVWVAHFKWVLSLNNLFWVRNNSEKLILGKVWVYSWATEFPRVWVRVGYPQLAIYPTTVVLKYLILLYSFKIKLNTCKNNSI
jgi:hypothetical protein